MSSGSESACPYCDRLVDDDSLFCKYCSSSLKSQTFQSFIASNIKNLEVIGIFAAVAVLATLDPTNNPQLQIVSASSLIIIIIIAVNIIRNCFGILVKTFVLSRSQSMKQNGLEQIQFFIFIISFSILIFEIAGYILFKPELNSVVLLILTATLSCYLSYSVLFTMIFTIVDYSHSKLGDLLGVGLFLIPIILAIQDVRSQSPLINQLSYALPMITISLIGIAIIVLKLGKKIQKTK